MWVAFANHIFQQNISAYNQRFNDTLTNDIISFEQLGPILCSFAETDDAVFTLNDKIPYHTSPKIWTSPCVS